MIYNEIINLEKQNGLCDINTISQMDTLQEQYLGACACTHARTHSFKSVQKT